MAESFDEYIARIESYTKGRDRLAILRKTPRALARRVAGATKRRLRKRPRPGKWSVGEVLAHLSEVELLWGYRIRVLMEKSGAPLLGMDQDAWAVNSRYREIDPRDALAAFTALRRANVQLLSRMRRKTLARWGAHSQFGRLTIDRIVTLLAGHDVNHSRQIEAILGSRARRGKR